MALKAARFAAAAAFALLLAGGGCGSDPVLAPPADTASAWRLVCPQDSPGWLRAAWGDGPERLMAVGYHGAILVREGGAWRSAPSPTTASFYDIHGCDWQHVWALSDEGPYSFDGRRWTRRGDMELRSADRVWCRAPDDVMIATGDGVSWHFDGAAWTRATLDLSWWNSEGNWLTGTPDGYIAVGNRGPLRWRQGRWEPLAEGGPRFLDAVCRADSAGQERYLAISFPGYVHEYVPGEGWSVHASLGGRLAQIVPGGGGVRAFLLDTMSGGTAAVRSDRGDTLAMLPADAVEPERLVSLATGGGGRPFVCTVGGVGSVHGGYLPGGGLAPLTAGPRVLPSWIVADPGGGFACVAGRAALMRGRAGLVDVGAPATDQRLIALAAAGPGRFAAVDARGAVWMHEADGSVRALAPAPVPEVRTVWYGGPADLWVGGSGGAWRGDGTGWTDAADSLLTVYQILGHGPDDVYLLERARILHWDGAALRVAYSGSHVNAGLAVPAPDGRGIFCAVEAVQGGGALYPMLRRVTPEGLGEPVAVSPGNPRALVALGGDRFLISTYRGLYTLENGRWVEMPHPAVGEGGGVPELAGDPVGGVYSISDTGIIHYLDLGGTGLWQ